MMYLLYTRKLLSVLKERISISGGIYSKNNMNWGKIVFTMLLIVVFVLLFWDFYIF